jgi:DNA polymerase III alpha subunit
MFLNDLDIPVFSHTDLIKEIYKGNINKLENCFIDTTDIEIIKYLEFIHKFNLIDWQIPKVVDDTLNNKKEIDENNQNNWFIPKEYINLDIQALLLSLCKTDQEVDRVNQELILFEKYNLVIVLKFLKFLVDIMRQHKIVWGVGRGSSVASFCLYLLGVHKINSLKYNLDINEFFH